MCHLRVWHDCRMCIYFTLVFFLRFIVMPLKPYKWFIWIGGLRDVAGTATSILSHCHHSRRRRRQFVTRHENGEEKADDYRHVHASTNFHVDISYSKSKHFQFMMLPRTRRSGSHMHDACLRGKAHKLRLFAHIFAIGSCVRLDKAKKYSQMRTRVRCTWVISFTSDYIQSAAHKYTDEMYMQRLVLVLCAFCMDGSRGWLRCTHKIWVFD